MNRLNPTRSTALIFGLLLCLAWQFAGCNSVNEKSAAPARVVLNFNPDWRFIKDDPAGAQAAFAKFESAYPAVAKHQDDLKLSLMTANGQWDKAYAIFAKQVDGAIARKDSMTLNSIAWQIVDPSVKNEHRDLELALRAATKADEFTEGKNPAIMDTLARTYYWKGDVNKAIEIETKAIGLATGDLKTDLEKSLAEFKTKNTQ